MTEIIQWAATLLTIVAASLIAAHINPKVTGAAFVIFTAASLLWIYFAAAESDHGLLVTNIVLTVINLTGVYRYLFSAKKPAA